LFKYQAAGVREYWIVDPIKEMVMVYRFEKETMEEYPQIEWIILKNLRNKIVHDYEGIKLNFIWDIITEDIVLLKSDLEQIIKENTK